MDIIKTASLVIVVLLCISAIGGPVSAASQDEGVPTHPPTSSEDSESPDSTDSDDSDSTGEIPETAPEPPEGSSPAGTVQLNDDTHDELKAGAVAVTVCGASLVVSGGGGCGAWAVAGYVGSQVVDSDNELKEDE